MKRAFYHILLLTSLCCSVFAQDATNAPSSPKLDEYMETGMEVSGVRAPYYDEEGTLKAQLCGEHAKILEGGVADVTNIRIEVFEKGAVFMTVFAPQCYTRVVERDGKKILSVDSEGDVLIEMEQMTITGRGFRFTSENNRFELLNDSKVLVKASARDARGLDL